ncbi:MAG: hypothetical protein US22_C0060G0004 [candidate division TM6 bacterium GW2011_GWF2_36_6]|nr:MAG: hypothetical protein US22_C0060G0004 [candidate division TM6 bacterium GW2011_GWF2_36_6]
MKSLRCHRLGFLFVVFITINSAFCMEDPLIESQVLNYIKACETEIDRTLPISYFCVCNKLLDYCTEPELFTRGSFLGKFFHLFSDIEERRQNCQVYAAVELLVKDLLGIGGRTHAMFSGALASLCGEEKSLRIFIAQKILSRIDKVSVDLRFVFNLFPVNLREMVPQDLLLSIEQSNFPEMLRWALRDDNVNRVYPYTINNAVQFVTPIGMAIHMRCAGGAASRTAMSTLILQLLIAAGASANVKTWKGEDPITLALGVRDVVATKILLLAGTEMPGGEYIERNMQALAEMGIFV